MAHVTGEIVINRPVDEVFDFVADERNEPKYNPDMLRAEQMTAGPIGQGTRFWAESVSRGRPVEMAIEFIDFDRPRRLAATTHLATMDIRGTLIFESVREGTRLRWCWDLSPRGPLKLLTPLIARMGRRQETAIWDSLKRYLEAPGEPL